ncbi:helix-turn-helix domain-containing protein [Gaetbulibacter aestuarii]|uniref:Helix-turn-helix domain-containing protein n=1 Tax=Gaetbulibacter aestuarii TaxID=1502358 RepID=A0ABW7N0N9_9FLAO
MVNTEEFAQRLQKVIDYYSESASSFADSIGVQRSSISHILSGRNKPSLDFVLKILAAYPDVELYWLLNGKGHFDPGSEKKVISETSKAPKAVLENVKETSVKQSDGKSIDRIVIFYTDGSFQNFQN